MNLRGHVTLLLSPVPQTGGQLLALLPRVGGSCPCSPSLSNPVIATTTAVTFPNADTQPGTATVCIVRLLVSRVVAADVNRNSVVDSSDETAVTSDLRFNNSVSCGVGCGPADVNLDGFINQLDVETIRNSTVYPTDVSCGAVYASSFSCGAYRSSPPQPAVGISLDEVNYRVSGGVLTAKRQSTVDVSVVYNLLTESAEHVAQSNSMRRSEQRLETMELTDIIERGDLSLAMKREKKADVATSRRMLLTDVMVAICVIVACSALTAIAMRRRS